MPLSAKRLIPFYAITALLAAVGCASAQTSSPIAALPEFEVATIKPIAPDGGQWGGVAVFPGGRITLTYPGGSVGFAERWVVNRTTMPQLARFASNYMVHCPAIDQTGLSEVFNYTAEAEGWQTYQQDPYGSFMTLLSNRGLKLELSKAPVEAFVIDRADKPSPN